MSKWIEFAGGETTPSGKTKRWEVKSKDNGAILGEVKWYGPWRQYTYFANPHTIYERQCLRDIADFCDRETTAQRETARRVKSLARDVVAPILRDLLCPRAAAAENRK